MLAELEAYKNIYKELLEFYESYLEILNIRNNLKSRLKEKT